MILAVTAGCDNVEWGGTSFMLEPPPPATVGVDTAPDVDAASDSTAAPLPPLPDGAVLYVGTRTGASVALLPLLELRGDTIRALTHEADAPGFNAHFAAERMAPGAQFTLFADGVRVGSLVTDSAVSSPGWCEPRPSAIGTPELIPAASGATRFLALAESPTPRPPHARGAFPRSSPALAEASRLLAQTAIMEQKALWPDDLGQARADLAITRLAPDSAPAVAATYMFRDRLAIEDPGTPVAYSLFVLGVQRADRYRLAYRWYRRVGDDGKGAPRFVQQFDWDGDGRTEMLLEVMGTTSRWPAVVEGSGTDWAVVHEERCASEAGSSGG